jgi:hypothetical protein
MALSQGASILGFSFDDVRPPITIVQLHTDPVYEINSIFKILSNRKT